jgi:hypothetical protein
VVGGSFTGEFEKYVKEGSGGGHLSPWGCHWRDFFTGDFERQVKEGSGDGASLSLGALRGGPGRGAPLLGTLKIYKRRLWKWNIFLYVGAS